MENSEQNTSDTQMDEYLPDTPWNTKTLLSGPFQIDNSAFMVWETRWGMWQSADSNGRRMLTALTREAVEHMTRWYLKCEQDGTLDLYTRVVNSGFVGGKL